MNCYSCHRPQVSHATICPHCRHDYPPLEADFRTALVDHLNRGHLPLRAWKLNVGTVIQRDRSGKVTGKFSAGPKKGTLDIAGVAWPGGLYLEFDLKVFHVVTPEQEARVAFLTQAGAVTFIHRYDPLKSFKDNIEWAEKVLMANIHTRRAACSSSPPMPSSS